MPESKKIHPVILSGGSGTRLWPLSRALHPKQLHRLVSDQTLIQETAGRFKDTDRFEPLLVICNEDHRFLIAEQLLEAGLAHDPLVLEPVARNTAPAVALASLIIAAKDADGLLLVAPADHRIGDLKAFNKAIEIGAQEAKAGALVTFGIIPDRPETGYGYIRAGKTINKGALRVEAFTEKPDKATAEKFIASGDHFWNSGIFLFRADRILAELEEHAPAILETCQKSIDSATLDKDFIRPGKDAFKACPSDSLDYAIMEKAENVVVVPVDMAWSDVGDWRALWEISDKDSDGNVTSGNVITTDTKNSYIRAEHRLVTTAGIEDLVIIETADAILVAHLDSAHMAKDIVEKIKATGGTQHVSHTRVERPWGYYEQLDQGENWQVKRIGVKPGAKLSLQAHNHRTENWIVTKGIATVTNGDKTFDLKRNESTFIPILSRHRLENRTEETLEIIEVQTGDYLGEDDIIRFDDIYGRAG